MERKLASSITKGTILRKVFTSLPNSGLNALIYLAGHSKLILENWDMDLL